MGRNNQWRESFRAGFEQGRQPGESRPQRIFGAAALLFVALACASIAWGNLSDGDAGPAADAEVAVSASGDVQLAVSKTNSLPSARRAYGKLAALLTDYTRRVSADIADEVLFNSRFSFGAAPGRFVRETSKPLRRFRCGATTHPKSRQYRRRRLFRRRQHCSRRKHDRRKRALRLSAIVSVPLPPLRKWRLPKSLRSSKSCSASPHRRRWPTRPPMTASQSTGGHLAASINRLRFTTFPGIPCTCRTAPNPMASSGPRLAARRSALHQRKNARPHAGDGL